MMMKGNFQLKSTKPRNQNKDTLTDYVQNHWAINLLTHKTHKQHQQACTHQTTQINNQEIPLIIN